mmetsp:Transcript_26402/g.52800  ORF Transcript_26402/g.52800 Transcript_26402/m.52800 type:complete len:217 (+) Transcript_26402:2-652(+)
MDSKRDEGSPSAMADDPHGAPSAHVLVKNTFLHLTVTGTVGGGLRRQFSAPAELFPRSRGVLAAQVNAAHQAAQAAALTDLLNGLSAPCRATHGLGGQQQQDTKKDATPSTTTSETSAGSGEPAQPGDAASNSGTEAASTPSRKRRIRPCKSKRKAWREVTARLELETAEDPQNFDASRIQVRASLSSNIEIMQRVREHLAEVAAGAREARSSAER